MSNAEGLIARLSTEWIWLDLVDLETSGDGLRITVRSAEPGVEPLSASLAWSRYFAYGVRNENYIVIEPRSERDKGPFRELLDTGFLKYARTSTWQEGGTLRHWQIACSDQILDIASDVEPEIGWPGLELAAGTPPR